MKKNLILCILLNIYLIKVSYQYLVLPFKYLNPRKSEEFNVDTITGKEFLDFTTNKLVTSLSVGTPFKSLELYITMDYQLFFIGNGYCKKDSLSDYQPSGSNSYTNQTFNPFPFDDLRNMTKGNDRISFYNDYELKSNVSLNNVLLYYGSMVDYNNNAYYKNKVCGIMGFKLHTNQDSYYNKYTSLYSILKENKISNHTFWTIEFFNEEDKKKKNNYDGYLILGAGDNKYLKDVRNISPDDIRYSYSNMLLISIEWSLPFSDIHYFYPKGNKTIMSNDYSTVVLNFDIKYYFATHEYFESIKQSFFNQYISKGICKINKLKEFYLRYNFITCDKTFKDEIGKFPTLYLYSTSFNETLELTYDDVFENIGNSQILFLIFYEPWNPKFFQFGEKFMRKYNFIFRNDQKNIGLLNFNKKDSDGDDKEKREEVIANQKKIEIIWIIILSVLLLGIIIGILVGKKIWDKNRKKRANELVDDDYEYESNNVAEKIIN